MKMKIFLTKVSLYLFGLALISSACTVIPVSGRKSIAMVDAGEMIPLANEMYSELLNTAQLSKNAQLVEKVRGIGNDLKAGTVARLEGDKKGEFILDYSWEFNVFESEEPMVWGLPGGFFGITTGMLDLCKNDDEIAAVLAHTLGHLVGNHPGERLHFSLRENFGSALFSRAVSTDKIATKQLLLNSAGASPRSTIPFTYTQEKEADEIGIFLLAEAGYNPRAIIDFWVRFEEEMGSNLSGNWATLHEGPSGRIVFLNNNLPQALVIFRDSPLRKN
jgi:predicted Zn-dependent protease